MKSLKQIATIIIGVVLVFTMSACEKKQPEVKKTTASKVSIVDTDYPYVNRAVTICSVMDFGAKGDGKTDDTDAFKNAISYTNSKGGGTIHVPEGKYVITKSLNLPNSVYLMGVWYNPDKEPSKITKGSILYCMADKGNLASKPFICAGSGSGAIGLTIYYPEQKNLEFPESYPATLGAFDAQGGSSGFSTFRYITLVNSYYGISAGPNGNECHIFENIYMTPLNKGIFVNMSSDIGRFEDIHIAAKYYSLYDKTIDKNKLITSLKKNEVTGIIIQRSDWQHGNKITISDIHTGIRFEKNFFATTVSDSANSAFINVSMENNIYGIDFNYARKMSETFTNLSIKADASVGSTCVIMRKAFNASVFLTGGFLSNPNGSCIVAEDQAQGTMSVSDLEFKEYKNTAVSMSSSVFSAVRSKFLVASLPAVISDKGCQGVTIDKCSYAGEKVKNINNAKVYIGNIPYEIENGWKDEISLPSVPLTSKKTLATITDTQYGAVADGKIDATKAIQKALDAMSKNGGGIVYMPAGRYLVNGTLSIPTGVELRGVSAGPHHTTSLGTYLYSTNDKDNEDGQAFITLEKGSGINGFTVWYPEQVYNNPVKYPYTIQGKGQDIWIVNITISNAWKGIDLASYDCGGHYVAYVAGMTFKNNLTIDKSSKKSYVYNCHFNPHFYGRTTGTNLAGGSDVNGVEKMMFALFSQMDGKLNGSLILGKTTDEQIFDFFSYRQKLGLVMKDGEGGKGPNGKFIFLGFDAAMTSLDISTKAEKDINLLAMTTDGFDYGLIKNSGIGVLKFINCAFSTWNADTRQGLKIESGNVSIDTTFLRTSSSAGNGTIVSKGGKTTVTNNVFNHVSVILNNQKNFAVSWETAVKDFDNQDGNMIVKGNIGIEHFGSEPPDNTNLVVVYEGSE